MPGCIGAARETAPDASKPASPPNIILILTDDQGWTDTSVRMMKGRPDSGSTYYRTPALEKMAREGMVFSNAYASSPVCSPTRDSILYGKTPTRLHHAVLVGKARVGPDALTIPRAVKAANANYVTAHFGKWACSPKTPEEVGFDVSDGRTDNWHGDWQKVDGKKAPVPADDPKRIFSVTRRANDFMAKQVKAGRPFYMRISHYACHVGHQSLAATRAKYRTLPRGPKSKDSDYRSESEIGTDERRSGWLLNYAAMIEDLDTGLGMVLDKLDDLGIADNTVVIFTSDNGGGFRENRPLAGGKADLWEGGIRVPMVVRGPGVSAGTYCDVPVVGWDFLPTIRDLAGQRIPLPAEFDGGSLRDVFEKGNAGTVKRGTEALVFHFPWWNGEPESAIRLGDYKLLKNLDTQDLSLFDLSKDIGEKRNLARTMPDRTAKLHAMLQDYLKAVGAEDVRTLRLAWRQRVVEQIIPRQEAKLAALRGQGKTDDPEFKRIQGHLKWLREQIVFTDNRLRMGEKNRKGDNH